MLSIAIILKQPELAAFDLTRRLEDVPGVTVQARDDPAAAHDIMREADVLVTLGPHLGVHAASLFAEAGRLKWVQVIGTGVDNVYGHPALDADVAVTNVHGIHGAQMSEAALAAMLGFARQLPLLMRNQQRHKWDRFPSRLLAGSSVGIVGIGAIAEALAPRCQALGMRVLGFSGKPRGQPGFESIFPRSELTERVGALDYLVVLAPHSASTHHLIDATVLAAMSPTAVLVNLARGGVVDEEALLHALRHNLIGGAALDVFVQEPLPESHPFWQLPNVILTPHTAGLHEGYADDVSRIIRENVGRFMSGGAAALMNRI